MNYVAFLSAGVFASLFFVIAAHYDPDEEGVHDYTPSGIIATIEDKQRQQVLLARDTHGIKVDERVIAAWEGENLNRFASVPTSSATPLNPSPTSQAQDAFTTDAWFRFVKSLFSSAS